MDEILAEVLGRRRTGPAGERTGNVSETLRLGFIEAALGGKRVVALSDGRKVEITVPAGVESGQRLRLRHGPLHETYLEIEVESHPLFRREGRDVHVDLPVTLTEAVLGAVVTVPTIHGDVALKVPPGSNSGAALRLRGKGILTAQGVGDHYAKLRVVLPEPPDPDLVAFLEHWGRKHPYQVRGKPRGG